MPFGYVVGFGGFVVSPTLGLGALAVGVSLSRSGPTSLLAETPAPAGD